MQSSSFRRANAAPSSSLPTGSRLSSTNGSILTSTGVASLDELFGGGLQLGSLILLKEDRCTTYAKVLLKYFIAQGMVLKHGVFVASSSPAETSEMVVKDLMGVVEGKIEDSDDGDSSNLPGSGSGRLLGQTRRGEDAGDRMKIAWRYQNLPQFSSGLGGANPLRPGMPPSASSPSSPSAPSSPYCHVYDLTKKMSPELIQSNIENMTCLNLDAQDPYQKLFTDIKKKIHQGGYHAGKVSSGRPLNILRIAIPSIGSGFWGSEEYNATALPKFLFALRGLLRSSLAVCVVTIPAYIYNDIYGVCTSPFIRACEHIADGVLEVESFAGRFIPFITINSNASY